MWSQSEGDAQPYLYLVNHQLDLDGRIGTYIKFNAAFHDFRREQTNPFGTLELDDTKLLAPHESRASVFLWYLGRYPDDQPTHRSHRGVPMEAAYVYPASLFAPVPAQPA